jgi:hypothetical protein
LKFLMLKKVVLVHTVVAIHTDILPYMLTHTVLHDLVFRGVFSYIVTCMSDYRGVWIGNWVYTNSRTLQFTTAHTKSSQSAVSLPVVVWQLLRTS